MCRHVIRVGGPWARYWRQQRRLAAPEAEETTAESGEIGEQRERAVKAAVVVMVMIMMMTIMMTSTMLMTIRMTITMMHHIGIAYLYLPATLFYISLTSKQH